MGIIVIILFIIAIITTLVGVVAMITSDGESTCIWWTLAVLAWGFILIAGEIKGLG